MRLVSVCVCAHVCVCVSVTAPISAFWNCFAFAPDSFDTAAIVMVMELPLSTISYARRIKAKELRTPSGWRRPHPSSAAPPRWRDCLLSSERIQVLCGSTQVGLTSKVPSVLACPSLEMSVGLSRHRTARMKGAVIVGGSVCVCVWVR